MNDLQAWISDVWAIEIVRDALRATAIMLVALILARLVNRRLRNWGADAHHRLITRRVVTALILGLALAWAMSELGLKLGVVLGAAGIFTVAIGFAAQTSVSNLISGLFLMAERPFQIGDVIEVGTTTGQVLSIDLLSIKLSTFDNLLVRIPNETMLKANVTNLTHFPVRRYDLLVGVAYHEDLDRVRDVLLATAEENPIALRNPAPSILFMGFGDSAVNLRLSAWATRENFLVLRNQLSFEVHRAFIEHDIEIPFPQRTLQVGRSAERFFESSGRAESSSPQNATERRDTALAAESRAASSPPERR